MRNKIIFGLLALFLGAALIYGCGSVSQSSTANNPNMSTTPATPPAGTTDVKLSGGNVNLSGVSGSLSMVALDQNNQVLNNMTLGNIGIKVYDTYPTGLSTNNVKAKAVVDAVVSLITNGSNTSRPIAVAMTLDKSGSMFITKVRTLEAAASMFVDLMPVNSKGAIINFDDRVSVEAAMTADRNILKSAISNEAYQGSTAIYEAIHQAIGEVKNVNSADYTRAIIAMTDGMDNSSYLYNQDENSVEAEAILNGLPIYTIGLFDNSSDAQTYRPPLVRIAETTTGTSDSYFEVIAGVTGLSAQSIRALGVLNDLYTKLAGALSNSYQINFSLPSSLVSGQQYYVVVNLNYGSFTKHLILGPYKAQ